MRCYSVFTGRLSDASAGINTTNCHPIKCHKNKTDLQWSLSGRRRKPVCHWTNSELTSRTDTTATEIHTTFLLLLLLLLQYIIVIVITVIVTLAASSGEQNVTVWRPSVCPSVCPVGILTVIHQGQHATRPAYISARQ